MYSKELLKGTIGVIILKLLQENGEMYGYEITQRVKEMSDDKILLKDGSLYPALHKLTNDGILSFREEKIGKRIRKYYFLTETGVLVKNEQLAELKDFLSTLNKILFHEINTQLS